VNIRLNEELANSTDPETVVGGFRIAVDLDRIFVDYLLVTLGGALLVIDIPPEELEERIQEILAKLRLVVRAAAVFVGVPSEALDEIL